MAARENRAWTRLTPLLSGLLSPARNGVMSSAAWAWSVRAGSFGSGEAMIDKAAFYT